MSDKTMSRIIPNKKQSDANSVLLNNIFDENKEVVKDTFDSRKLDSYKSTAIFRSDDYLVIDKPYGVRMNGEFEGDTIMDCSNHFLR